MSEHVDELFGEGAGAPTPRVGLAIGLLVGGLLIGVLGLFCTAIPGGILVLLSWFVVERDLDRVESGYLPQERAATLRRLRLACQLGIVAVIGLEVFQVLLYNGRFPALVEWFQRHIDAIMAAHPAPVAQPPTPPATP